VWAGRDGEVSARAERIASTGQRVLLLARTDAPLDGEALPRTLDAVALVLLEEQVRPDAAETLEDFAQQGVALRVISGDSPHTVGAVAARVGMPHADRPVDAREPPEDPDALRAPPAEPPGLGRAPRHPQRALTRPGAARPHTAAPPAARSR